MGPLQSKTQTKKKKKTWRARKKILRMKSQWTLMKRRMRLRRVMIMRMRIWMTRWLEEKEATVDVIEEGTLTIEKFRAFVSCITRSGEALARYPAIEAILVTDTSRGEEVLRAAEQYVRGREGIVTPLYLESKLDYYSSNIFCPVYLKYYTFKAFLK